VLVFAANPVVLRVVEVVPDSTLARLAARVAPFEGL